MSTECGLDFWRIFDALQQRGITPTLAINGIVCESYPSIAQAAHKADWEFMGHGYIQGPMHKVDDQVQAIDQTIQSIKNSPEKHLLGGRAPALQKRTTP